jgi:general secretion pathway protein D
MNRRLLCSSSLLLLTLMVTGCPKGKSDFKAGQEAELNKDYDTALIHYERAAKADPSNAQYEMRAKRVRFQAAQAHVDRGHKLRDQGLYEPAAAEFEKALAIDPSSFVAEQELRRTLEMIVAQRQAQAQAARQQQGEALVPLESIPEGPPQLRPLSREPLNLKMTEDSRKIYESISRLAGINVIFDADFQARRVTVELTQATLEQALDITSLMTKSFWKAVTSNTIMIIPDSAAKRRSYEEQIIKTFYLANTVEAAELNEIVQTLRTLLDIKRITPSTANNAIIIRDTPDKVAVADKIIRDIDQAKPEVQIQVAFLSARRDRARELGIIPSSTVPVIFTPKEPVETSQGDAIRLSDLGGVSSADYSIILPSATAMALLTDSTTKIIQHPEVRVTDGQTGKLRIGDRVPYAVGSFQPGIGGVGINPLVNTQFQYQDVGVNLDVTPRVHTNREMSLHLKIEISAVTGTTNIGGVQQPIFGQRIVEHDIRLREGEVSILGGIVERIDRVSIEGWPGLAQIPFLRYFFSSETKESQEGEVLIVLTPRLIRVPEITSANLRPLAVGTDENVALPRPPGTPSQEPQPPAEAVPPESPPSGERPSGVPGAAIPSGPAQMNFQPAQSHIQVGERVAVDLLLENVQDIFSVPLAVGFEPTVVELVEVYQGSLLGGGAEPAALVHRVDSADGMAIISVMRAPGTTGATGRGTLVTLVFQGKTPGTSALSIKNIAARNSRQELLSLETGVGEIRVE